GAGTLFPTLSGTAVGSAPGGSFATATGMNSVARQIGAALGVAIVVAVIGTPTRATAYAAFQHAWIFGAVCLFAAGLGCVLVGPVTVGQAPAVADAAPAVPAEAGPHQTAYLTCPRPRRMIGLDTAGPTARTPLFSDTDPELRKQLAAQSQARHLAAGQWLYRQHEPADAMYVVHVGRLEAVDEAAGVVIGEFRRGNALGELGLLTGSPRSESVRAVRATEVIAICRADFTALLHGSPALSLALNRSLGGRLQDTRTAAPTGRPRSR
ncbi:MAG: cyclic nucleotide-binding domain-containing protein, partial [Streptosporangiaceae bacterium]